MRVVSLFLIHTSGSQAGLFTHTLESMLLPHLLFLDTNWLNRPTQICATSSVTASCMGNKITCVTPLIKDCINYINFIMILPMQAEITLLDLQPALRTGKMSAFGRYSFKNSVMKAVTLKYAV